MKILIINPNTTASMTHKIADAAQFVALPTTNITALNPETGPASIQGRADGEAALPGLFSVFDAALTDATPPDAVIIACFDDTGLETLKTQNNIPVIGIGEAAFHMAALSGRHFSTVTTLAQSVPIIEENIERYGFTDKSRRVRASGVPVLALEEDDTGPADQIIAEAKRAVAEDKCDTIVLGCAGMADLAARVTAEIGKPAVDGVVAAVGLCEAIHRTKTV